MGFWASGADARSIGCKSLLYRICAERNSVGLSAGKGAEVTEANLHQMVHYFKQLPADTGSERYQRGITISGSLFHKTSGGQRSEHYRSELAISGLSFIKLPLDKGANVIKGKVDGCKHGYLQKLDRRQQCFNFKFFNLASYPAVRY